MDMVRIEGKQLQELRETLYHSDCRLLRIGWHGDHVTFKMNEGVWSPPMGSKQEPY